MTAPENNIHRYVKEIQLHVLAGCSDSRDISSDFNDAREDIIAKYAAKGILVDIARISIPGVSATGEIISEIKTLIFGKMKEYADFITPDTKFDIYIHMLAHGNVHLRVGAVKGAHSIHDIEVVEKDPMNCGMTHAEEIANHMESLLLTEKPTLQYGIADKTKKIKIKDEASIEQFMKEAYLFNGTIAGNWIESIHNLVLHPFRQKKILRKMIDSDDALKNMGIHITAGIQNYATSEYFRVDNNTHLNTAIDEIYHLLHSNGKAHDHESRINKQNPEILLFHHGLIPHARSMSVTAVYGDKEKFSAGRVFAIGGFNADDYYRPFGPTKTAGFYMCLSPAHLRTEQMVIMGQTKEQTQMMNRRLYTSPLTQYFMEHFKPKTQLVYVDKGEIKSVNKLFTAK